MCSGLAALLYRAATESEPVPSAEAGGGSPVEQVMAKVRDPREIRGDLPAPAVALLHRGLEKDPRDRHPDADSLAQELVASLSHPVPAEAASLAGRTPTVPPRPEPIAPTIADDADTDALAGGRGRWGRRLVPLGIAAVVAALGGGALGALVAAGDDPRGGVGAALASGAGAIALPAGWVPRSALPPTGLRLEDGVAGEPATGLSGVSLVMGIIDPPAPRLFPREFGDRLWRPQVRPSTRDRVVLGESPALRFRDLKLDDQGTGRATLFMVPTSVGTLAIGCLSPASEAAAEAHLACEGAAGTLRLGDGVEASGVGPDAVTGDLIQGVIDDVAREREALYAALQTAAGGFSQERLLGPASKRIEAAGNRLVAASSSDPAEAARLRELRDAIRNYAGHLRRAGDAARAGDAVERGRRVALAGRTEAEVIAQIARLRELGYGIADPTAP